MAFSRLERPARILVWLLVACAALGIYRLAESFFNHLAGVAVVLVFGSLLAVLLTPAVDAIQKVPPFRSHRVVAVLVLYIAVGALLVGVVWLAWPGLRAEVDQIPEMARRLESQVREWGVTLNLGSIGRSGLDAASTLGLISGVAGALISIVLVVVISIYLTIQGRTVIATLRNLFPAHERKFDFLLLAVGTSVTAYVRGQLFMSFLVGTYTGLMLWALGIQYALVLGIAAFFLEFIPVLGAAVSMAMVVGVALVQSPGLAAAALVIGGIGHALEAYVVGPRVAARVTQLNPLVAMAAVLIGGEVAGVLGALFAVPVAATLNIVLGAVYRSSQGDEALSTHARGTVTADDLPRLGEEIGGIEADGVADAPVPRQRKRPAKK